MNNKFNTAPVATEQAQAVAWANVREDGVVVGLSQHPEDIARWVNPQPPCFAASPEAAPAAPLLMQDENSGREGRRYNEWHASRPDARLNAREAAQAAATPAAPSDAAIDACKSVRASLARTMSIQSAAAIEGVDHCIKAIKALAPSAQPAAPSAGVMDGREAFEAAYVKDSQAKGASFTSIADMRRGEYDALHITSLWEGWQMHAALALAAPVLEEVEVPRERIGGYLNFELRNAYGDVRFGGFDISAEQFNAIAEILERAPMQQDAPAPSMVGDADTVTEMAKRLYNEHPTYRGTRPLGWYEVPKALRREWLDKAHAAISGQKPAEGEAPK